MDPLHRALLGKRPSRDSDPGDRMRWAARATIALAALSAPVICAQWVEAGSVPWLLLGLDGLIALNGLWLLFVASMIDRRRGARSGK
jgi:hypothetical protein